MRARASGFDWAEGRRSKASSGGSRGQGPWAMGISPRGLVDGVVRGVGRRRDAPTLMLGSLGFAAPWTDPGRSRSPLPSSGRTGLPALWPRPVVVSQDVGRGTVVMRCRF